jgi:hypothetical protein
MKDGIYTAMNGRDIRMGEWNNRRQWNMKDGIYTAMNGRDLRMGEWNNRRQ